MQIELLTSTVIPRTHATEQSIGLICTLILYSSVQFYISPLDRHRSNDTYLHIAPRSGLPVKQDIHTLAGIVDPDFTENIVAVLHTFDYTILLR